MTSRAARRLLRRNEAGDFPALPTLACAERCDGLAFVVGANRPAPDLKPLRDRVRAIWRGRLEGADGAPYVTALAFTGPTDARSFAAALPLIARAGTLTSFAAYAQGEPAIGTGAAPGLRSLELFWGGRRHRIPLDTLEQVPIAELWDAPEIVVHRPLPVAAGSRATHRVPRTAPAAAARDLTRVSHAPIPFMRAKSDPLREVEDRLQALGERTSLSALLKQAIGLARLPLGVGGGADRAAAGGGQKGQAGLLHNLAGWIRWHTPLGAGLRRQFGQRLGLVERLIAKGEIDGALKLALRLGGGQNAAKPRTRYPNRLPAARAQLDFEIEEAFTAPILGGGDLFHLHGRYHQLAQELRRKGDHRRAAYIQSKLLGDHSSAVLTLEAGELFAEAASLAVKSRQPPPLAIRMLYQAGERDAALALARRTSCFDELVEDSRNRDPAYHDEVVKAWTDDLVATGQPLRALQVTDHLTARAAPAAGLISARKKWMAAALAAEERDGFSAETAVRGLLIASWTAADIPASDAYDFPAIDAANASPAYAAVIQWLQEVVRGETSGACDTMLDLLAAFVRLTDSRSKEQAPFWSGPAQPVAEAFTRALLGLASSGLQQADLQALQAFLGKADLPVLALDIRRLRTLHKSAAQRPDAWQAPPPGAPRPPVGAGCLLANGNVLLWRRSDLLQLLDRHGALLWQQSLKDVIALVPIGTSPNVIVVQKRWDGTSLLTRLATHSRSFHPIGAVDLAAHHDVTSEGQWLVQIGNGIGALDLVKLCGPAPAIEFLWSCALTSNLRAVAFADDGSGAPAWLTRDVSDARYGIVELWTLRNGSELQASLCLPVARGGEDVLSPRQWWWVSERASSRFGAVEPNGAIMSLRPWSDQAEREALALARKRTAAGFTGFDSFQSCGGGDRAWVRCAPAGDERQGGAGETRIEDPRRLMPAFTVSYEVTSAISFVTRGAAVRDYANKRQSAPPGPVLLADESGRALLIDLSTRRGMSL